MNEEEFEYYSRQLEMNIDIYLYAKYEYEMQGEELEQYLREEK